MIYQAISLSRFLNTPLSKLDKSYKQRKFQNLRTNFVTLNLCDPTSNILKLVGYIS